MEKITLSLHNPKLKKQIKKYAEKRGISISGIVENYLENLIKVEIQERGEDYGLPADLEAFLDGIEVDEEIRDMDYKTLRNNMYGQRAK